MEPEAGPSQLPAAAASTSSNANHAFVPVPGLSEAFARSVGQGMPRSSISGTQDLLGAFGLIGLYNQVVRPYVKPLGQRDVAAADIKGKGKAEENGNGQPADPNQPAGAAPPAGPKKMPRGYTHLVPDLPGTYSTQRDNYLKDLSYKQDFQPVQMQTFDEDTLRSAFALEQGITPEVEAHLGIYQTKKKKSKRKREQLAGAPPPISGASPNAAGTPSRTTPDQPNDAGGDEEGQGHSKKRKTVRLND